MTESNFKFRGLTSPSPPALSPEQLEQIVASAARSWDAGLVKRGDRAGFINFCVEQAKAHHKEINQ